MHVKSLNSSQIMAAVLWGLAAVALSAQADTLFT
jgi:hypothetical protein